VLPPDASLNQYLIILKQIRYGGAVFRIQKAVKPTTNRNGDRIVFDTSIFNG
jgi:hypothetical protein